MNCCSFRHLLFVLVLVLSFQFACKSSTVKPDEAEALTQRLEHPKFFQNIPADSPYVVTGMEPVPLDLIESTASRFGVAIDKMFALVESLDEDTIEALRQDVAGRVLYALMGELRGNLSVKGLHKLGFSTQPSVAFYGIGPLPVYRMSLHDPSAFEAFLQRVESAAGLEVKHHKMGDVSYRVYSSEDFKELIVPLAIQGNEVIVGAAPQKSAAVFLPYMIGIKLPKDSLASNNQIKEIVGTYGLRPFMVGYVDVKGIGDALLQHRVVGSVMNEVVQTLEDEFEDLEQSSEVCRSEIRAIYSDMPRVVMGTEGFSSTEIQAMAALEVKSSFAGRLAQTRAPIPAMSSHMSRDVMASFGVGVDIEKFIGFLAAVLQDIQDEPFQCEDAAFLNQSAGQFEFLSAMIPSFIRELRGFSVVLKALSPGEDDYATITSADAFAILKTTNPTELFQNLQELFPVLEAIALDGESGIPVAVQGIQELEGIMAPHIATLADALGFSVGVGMQDEMAMALESDLNVVSPLLLLTYDHARFLPLLSESGIEGDEFEPAFRSLTDALEGIEKSTLSLDASPGAIFMRYKMELKPANP